VWKNWGEQHRQADIVEECCEKIEFNCVPGAVAIRKDGASCDSPNTQVYFCG